MRDILAFELFLQSSSLLFPIPFLPVLKYFYPLVLKNAENFEIDKFWEKKKNELPLMWKASRSLWTPASAADVERGFSILTLLDSPKRANLSEEALKNLLYCYFNSDFIKFEWSFELNLQFTHVLPKEQK